MATWNDLIDAGLRKIGRLESGGTPTTPERTSGLAELNSMLGSWSAEMGTIYFETTESLSWASGNASRTIGASGNLDTARPLKILSAQFRDASNNDFDLQIITHQQYQSLFDKGSLTSDFPLYLAYNPTNASNLGTLFLYPTPSATITLRLTSWKPFAVITDATATIALPPGYEDAITPNLAVRFGDGEFAADVSPGLRSQAIQSKRALVWMNIQSQPMQPDGMAPSGNSGSWSALTDNFG